MDHVAEKRTARSRACLQTRAVLGDKGAWIVNPTVVNQAEAVQYVLNILFFMPYGLLFPWKGKWKQVFVAAFVLSVCIELFQLIFNLGWCEVDDVISNILGAMIGWGVVRRISRKEEIDTH